MKTYKLYIETIKNYQYPSTKSHLYGEEMEINPGDFALFYYDRLSAFAYHIALTPELKEFINNNVGIIRVVSNKNLEWIDVFYENIPKSIANKFAYNTILLNKDALIATSSDKEELETMLSAKKYNL